MAVIIQLRRDSAANWTTVNPVLHDGELGIERDTGKAKLGDGSSAWNSLSYWQPTGPDTDNFDAAGSAATETTRALAAEALLIPSSKIGAVSGVAALDAAKRLVTPVGGFLLPSAGPVSRTPAWRPASYGQIFQTGHGWTTNGTGIGSSNLNDTSVFVKGTQSVTITTAGNGQQAAVRSTSVPTQDLTGKALRITFKIDDVTHLNHLQVFVGSSSFTNNFNWTFHTHSGSTQNIIQSGEWVTLTTSWADVQTAAGSYTVSSTGVPSTTSGFTAFQVAAFDDSVGTVTMHLQSIEVVSSTTATFPNGVVSVVFDDSFQNVYDNARPIMDALGYRGTLYTISDVIGTGGSLTMTELKNLQTISGWEIGGHAYTSAAHNAGYDTLTALQVADEMRYMRAWMLANGFPVDSFAYPHGTFANTTDSVPIDQICGQYFSTGRSVISETAETFPPAMAYRLRSKTGISSAGGGGTLVSSITATGGPLDRCQLDGSWYIINLHQVVTSGVSTSTQILQSDFSTLMSAISSRGIPVLPVGDVIRNYS